MSWSSALERQAAQSKLFFAVTASERRVSLVPPTTKVIPCFVNYRLISKPKALLAPDFLCFHPYLSFSRLHFDQPADCAFSDREWN
jgi:hypothetical protein